MSIKYSEDHEWVDAKEDDLVVIGITDFAQEQLGDLVYVELPEVGDECTKGENISVLNRSRQHLIQLPQFQVLLLK